MSASQPFVIALSELESNPAVARFEGAEHGGAELSFFVSNLPPGHGPNLHEHPYPEVFIVEDGTATFTAGSKEFEVGAGNVVVVPGATPHRFENSGEGPLHVVSIHPSASVKQTDLD